MTPTYLTRHMRLEDIPQVVSIDRLSFSSPWSPNTYQFEVNNRETSHLVVIEVHEAGFAPVNGLRGLVQRLLRPKTAPLLAGYGGCWLIAGEAHISTIAVHPDFRGRGLGELLLTNMLQRAMNLDGEYSVLEVRASNRTAQALYEKYEYKVVGRRKGYYRDDGEDALLMEVRPFDEAYRQRFAAHVAALSKRVTYHDQFTRQSKAEK
ncbi:MAG: ribosomal protein S18-alanine N-acetyltransferase [Chloroflexi bacterium]|nr:ribosomal protein S18-alanine N-acetyltransferase [Chloroflexota bacterium]